MKCPNCDTDTHDGTKYCPSCGYKLPQKTAGGVVTALAKIIACVLIMLAVEIGVTAYYTASLVSRDAQFVAGMSSIAEKVSAPDAAENAEEITKSFEVMFTDVMNRVSVEVLGRTPALSIVSALVTVLILFLGLRLRKHEPLRYLRIRAVNPARILTFLLFGAALNIVLNCVISLIPFPQEIIEDFSVQFSDLYDGKDSLAVKIISTGLLTPILEELIFRAFAVTHLRPVTGKTGAVVISAAIFAAAHYGFTSASFIAVGYAFVSGLIFGAAFVKYDSVIPSMLFHIGFNSITFVKFNADGTIPYTVLLLALLLVCWCAYRIFACYPTFSDVIAFTNNVEPRDSVEAGIIERIKEIKTGEEEPDKEEINALAALWEENIKSKKEKVEIKADRKNREGSDDTEDTKQ